MLNKFWRKQNNEWLTHMWTNPDFGHTCVDAKKELDRRELKRQKRKV